MQLKTSVRFQPNLRAIAQLTNQSGLVGRATRNAAETTVERAKASVNAFGRVDTGYMRDSIAATFAGSNQYETRFSISSAARYSFYQHQGTRWISPAPFLTNAINRLTPGDFHQ